HEVAVSFVLAGMHPAGNMGLPTFKFRVPSCRMVREATYPACASQPPRNSLSTVKFHVWIYPRLIESGVEVTPTLPGTGTSALVRLGIAGRGMPTGSVWPIGAFAWPTESRAPAARKLGALTKSGIKMGKFVRR